MTTPTVRSWLTSLMAPPEGASPRQRLGYSDVFLAFGAVLLIQGFYAQNGIVLEPLHIALWALPTAVAAFVIHSLRIVLFARSMRKERGDA